MAGPNTICLKVNAIGEKYGEGLVKAAKTIKPGHLIESTADAVDVYGRETMQPHSVALGKGEQVVAIEEFFTGGTIDDLYPAGAVVRFHRCLKGDLMWMLLKIGENILPTDYLESAGDGTLQKLTTGVALFKAAEIKDNTSGGLVVRIRARAL